MHAATKPVASNDRIRTRQSVVMWKWGTHGDQKPELTDWNGAQRPSARKALPSARLATRTAALSLASVSATIPFRSGCRKCCCRLHLLLVFPGEARTDAGRPAGAAALRVARHWRRFCFALANRSPAGLIHPPWTFGRLFVPCLRFLGFI